MNNDKDRLRHTNGKFGCIDFCMVLLKVMWIHILYQFCGFLLRPPDRFPLLVSDCYFMCQIHTNLCSSRCYLLVHSIKNEDVATVLLTGP